MKIEDKTITEPERRTPIFAEVDVVVVGSGPAGLTAALAAARNGARATLVERYGFLGGQLTAEHTSYPGTPTLGLGFQDNKGNQIVCAIGWEIIEKLKARGAAYGPIKRRLIFDGKFLDSPGEMWGPKIDGEALKTLALEMVQEAGSELMLHTLAVDVIKQGSSDNDTVSGVIVQNKSGRQAILAKVVVDASADADIAIAAGAPFEKMARDELWAMSVFLLLGNVDTQKAVDFIRTNPDRFSYVSMPEDENAFPKELQFPLFACLETKKHDIKVSADQQVLTASYPQGNIHLGFYRGIAFASGGFGGDATDVKDLTQAEIVGRKRAIKAMEWLRENIPGFERCVIVGGPPLGTRESRRIDGEYKITKEDVMEQKRFPDSIGLNCMPLDMHLSDGAWEYRILKGPHQIPYRSLVPKKVENLLVAGRCVSCDHIAQSSMRKATACMVTGQAAGTAAALSARSNTPPRSLDIGMLQKRLKEQGIEIGDLV